jgi:quercetin dioxygenase-like cupin family protein
MTVRASCLLLAGLLLSACGNETDRKLIEEFRVDKAAGEDLEVIISEARIPPNTTIPPHYHPGEEIVLLLEGSALHSEQGKPDRHLVAGKRVVIPTGVVHSPTIGPEGAHIVVIYLVPKGEEVTIQVPAVD